LVLLVITFGHFWEGTDDTIRLVSRKSDCVAEMDIG